MSEAGPGRGAGTGAAAFVLPAALVYGAFCLLPVVLTLVMSFYSFPGDRAAGAVGLQHYRRLIADPVFWQALVHNFFLLGLSLAIQLPLATLLAWLLSGRATFARGFFRAAFFVPMILPTAVIAILWSEVFEVEYGLLNALWTWLGGQGPAWLDRPLVLWSLIGVISWRYVGFHLVIIMAGMEGVSREQVEAARVDGAGPWQVFRHVVLPALRPALAVSALLSVIGSLKYFDLVYLMTDGGPAHASELVATYVFKEGIATHAYGYASALATALLVIVLAVTFVARRLAGRIGGD